MLKVSIYELQRNPGKYLTGNLPIAITYHGLPIVKIVPFTPEPIKKESKEVSLIINPLDSITEEDVAEIANQYQVNPSAVWSKVDDIKNYCESKGVKYKDYKATLRNWVKRDVVNSRKEEHGKSKIAFIK